MKMRKPPAVGCEFMQAVFSGLSPLVIKDMTDKGERILVRA